MDKITIPVTSKKNHWIVTLGEEMRDWQKALESTMFLSQQIVGSGVIIVLGDVIRNPQCLERMLNNFKYKHQLKYKKLQEQTVFEM